MQALFDSNLSIDIYTDYNIPNVSLGNSAQCICSWIVTKMSHLANYTLFPQLTPILIHYLCTVALPGLADWPAFLEWVLPTMSSHNLQWGHRWH